MSHSSAPSMFAPAILLPALKQTVLKLDPRTLVSNPVIAVTALASVLATIFWVRDLNGAGDALFSGQIALWLWLTVLFANFAEAVAEGRGKAQAASLRKTSTQTMARKLASITALEATSIAAPELKVGDLVLCEAGDVIPADGDVVEGVATVDESAITGESAPVIRESGGDRSAVTGGTRVLSDRIVVRVSAAQGSGFLDRMIALVEGADRRKTPNEIALAILLAGFSLIFLIAVTAIPAFATYAGGSIAGVLLVALFITLIPTTIAGLVSAIGVAGMNRLVQFNVLALSGRAVEAAGDVDVLLLDKTGTITLGNRQATAFLPVPGVTEEELAEAAQLASLADETPEGRSIVVLAKERFALRGRDIMGQDAVFIPFTAQTRMSGIDWQGEEIRKGATDSVIAYLAAINAHVPPELSILAETVGRAGGTPLAVTRAGRALGIVHLKDIVKGGVKERFAQLRAMGIRTVMITGDNPLTAAAIAAEAGVDDFLAQATPEMKLALIREEQAKGKLVAMCGDGTNDAPALAQADVGVAMQTGTMAAREAGNMIDLDSDPTKLIEIVGIGKQLLMTRGALTTFSLSNDVAKYFAIIPAMFAVLYPGLDMLNVMNLGSPQSAVLSAIIFNALVIVALIPLALKGVTYKPAAAGALLARNLTIYGLGGLIVPFLGIKAIDMIVSGLGLA